MLTALELKVIFGKFIFVHRKSLTTVKSSSSLAFSEFHMMKVVKIQGCTQARVPGAPELPSPLHPK